MKLGRKEKGLWNATLPEEFTCTNGLVITNDRVRAGLAAGLVPVVLVAAGVCEMVKVPVQSAFTV